MFRLKEPIQNRLKRSVLGTIMMNLRQRHDNMSNGYTFVLDHIY